MRDIPQLINEGHGIRLVLGTIVIVTTRCRCSLVVDPIDLALYIFCFLALIPDYRPVFGGFA